MPLQDAMMALHGSPSSPSNIFTATNTTDVADYVIDFGAPATGASTPYLTQFPSITEKGYTFPPEVVGEGGVVMGVHLVITTACTAGTGMTAGTVVVTTGATDALGTSIASRTLTLAQLAVVGAHYFIPVVGVAVLEFLSCYFQAVTQVAGAGKGYAWFGPKVGGEM